jgi:hypothetical protein
MTLNKSKAQIAVEDKLTPTLEINAGVRQGDPLSALLFNLTLESVIRNLEIRGNITTKLKQINAYADDTVITARTKKDLIQTCEVLERESIKLGLKVNETKTKYMHLTRNKKAMHELKIGKYKFVGISRFTYLGSVLTENNSIIAEINERIKKGNATFYKNRKLLTSKLLARNIKLRLYLALIRPILTYGAETWAATESELQKLLIVELKIYGAVKDGDNWRIRTNSELDTLTGGVNIVRYIKAQRLRWFGHIQRMEDHRMVKKLTNWKPFGKRPTARPKNSWIDGVLKDMHMLKVKNWKELIGNRKEWNNLVKKVKTHPGL